MGMSIDDQCWRPGFEDELKEAEKLEEKMGKVLEAAWDETAAENERLKYENDALYRQIRCIDLRIEQLEKEEAKSGRLGWLLLALLWGIIGIHTFANLL